MAGTSAGDGGRTSLGLDLGGTKILGVAVDAAGPGAARAEVRRPTPVGRDAIVRALGEVVEELQAATSGGGGPARGVGLGAAGLVDRDGVVRAAPNLPGIADWDVGPALAARTGLPVTVENDATCAAWAEQRWGAARGATSLVLVALGTGIGAGIVLDGRPWRGHRGFAGEPGHAQVHDQGRACVCGRIGCWERYASGSGLGAAARERAGAGALAGVVARAGGTDRITGEHVVAAALAGDDEADDVLRDFARWVAVGIANLVDVLDPEVVVVGGGVAEVGEPLLGPVREEVARRALVPAHRRLPIVGAELGERAGALGAALLGAAGEAE